MTRKLNSVVALVGVTALMFGTAGCSSSRGGNDTSSSGASGAAKVSKDSLIGISMPTKSLERWNRDGAHLQEKLKSMGYSNLSLQYADNKTDQQTSQLQNMINQGAKILVVAAIDGTALTPVLQTAASKGIKVIAYDRLINGSKNVDYYATFDNYKVGQLQGNFIKEKIGSKKVNLEAFAGSPDDNNAKFFFSGAWDVLNPLIKSGQITVPSGKAPKSNNDWKSIGIQGWTSDSAQSEMQNRLNSFYSGKKVNVVLSPNDSLALGIAQALAAAGYKPGADYPILTGQDADLANVKNIIAGKQSMTVWKDTRSLGDEVAKMVDQIATGQKVDVNDTKSYDNGVKVVPTYLLAPVVVTKDDIKSKLIDSGFYKASDLGM